MPMWQVHYPKGLYDAADRQAFAAQVTEAYHKYVQLPKFYVVVAFHELEPDRLFVGGEPADRYVRITIDQVATQSGNPESQRRWIATLNEQLSPFIAARGLNSEIHIDNTPIDFWTIDGLVPPPHGSEDERRWFAENEASAPTGS